MLLEDPVSEEVDTAVVIEELPMAAHVEMPLMIMPPTADSAPSSSMMLADRARGMHNISDNFHHMLMIVHQLLRWILPMFLPSMVATARARLPHPQ